MLNSVVDTGLIWTRHIGALDMDIYRALAMGSQVLGLIWGECGRDIERPPARRNFFQFQTQNDASWHI